MGMSKSGNNENQQSPGDNQTDFVEFSMWFAVAIVLLALLLHTLPKQLLEIQILGEAVIVVRNAGLIVGGIAGFILAFLRYRQIGRQTHVAERAADETDKESKRKDAEAERKSREEVEKSFDKAVAALNGEDIAFSLYGASRMKQLAIDHSKDYLETAIRLIGNRARRTIGSDGLELEETVKEATKAELRDFSREFAQIALELAGSFGNKYTKKRSPLDLRGVDLSGLWLEGITITENRFVGCDFEFTHFKNCTFSEQFIHEFNARIARFYECQFNESSWVGQKACFVGAEFYECKFNYGYFGACDFGFAKFYECKIRVGLLGKIFMGSDLTKTKFRFDHKTIEATDSDFRNYFSSTDFQGCTANRTSGPVGLQENIPPLKVEEVGVVSEDNQKMVIQITEASL